MRGRATEYRRRTLAFLNVVDITHSIPSVAALGVERPISKDVYPMRLSKIEKESEKIISSDHEYYFM